MYVMQVRSDNSSPLELSTVPVEQKEQNMKKNTFLKVSYVDDIVYEDICCNA